MTEYLGIVVAFVLAGGITGLMIFLASTLGKKNPSVVKLEPFECGKTPFALPGGKLAIKFYLTAILFILFLFSHTFVTPIDLFTSFFTHRRQFIFAHMFSRTLIFFTRLSTHAYVLVNIHT